MLIPVILEGLIRLSSGKDNRLPVSFDEVHELLARLGLLEESGKIGRGCQRVLLLHASHLHAHVLRLDHHHHAQRIQYALDTILDLHGETLLDLQTTGKNIDHPGNLAQSGNVVFGDIGNMGLPEEG